MIATASLWRTKDEYVTALARGSSNPHGWVRDLRDVEHSIEVAAGTLYEAIATALAALQQDNWVRRDRSRVRNGNCSCPAAACEARSQNEKFCLMARTPRTFARRSHAEAKAGESIGQSKPREDVTEKAKQTNAQEDISELALSRRGFLGVLQVVAPLATPAFTDDGCVMVAPGAKGLFLQFVTMR